MLKDTCNMMSDRSGVSVGRLPDGSVLLAVGENEYIISDASWASLVCHVTTTGETPNKWFQAMAFHNDATAKVLVVNDNGISEP